MKYLIDTHILIWAAISPQKLSQSMADIIKNPLNQIYVSTISLWEIAIKLVIKKLDLNGIGISDLIEYCKELNINIIEFPISAAIQYQNLPLKENHRDPFDRGLISLCISEGYTLLSNDGKIFQYKTDGLQYNN